MFYYTVNKIGDGTEDNPFRPDLPKGTSFAGYEKDGEFLVAIPREIIGNTKLRKQLPRQALEATAKLKGLNYEDVANWFVGD